MNKSLEKILIFLKKFWNYLWYDDSFGSYVLNFAVAFVVIKFLIFPGLGFVLNNDYPIVAIVSGSMEHKIVPVYSCSSVGEKGVLFGLLGTKTACLKESYTYSNICNVNVMDVKKKNLDFDEWWQFCGSYYESNYNITSDEFREFEYKNGLNIGDVMVLYGKDPAKIEVGEVLIFVPQDERFYVEKGPVIHRVVEKWMNEEGKYVFRTKGDHNPTSIQNFENEITEDNVIGVSIVRIPFIGYAKLALNEVFMFLF
jgi:hypothetical protein